MTHCKVVHLNTGRTITTKPVLPQQAAEMITRDAAPARLTTNGAEIGIRATSAALEASDGNPRFVEVKSPDSGTVHRWRISAA